MAVDVGRELAQARKTRALSLDDLSRRTRIRVASLSAIERGDLTQLPGGIFTRGFVRAYAREVGCDPETAVARFLAEYGDGPRGAVASVPDPEADQPAACKSGQIHVA
jgi:cytoskeleton protein RodZ